MVCAARALHEERSRGADAEAQPISVVPTGAAKRWVERGDAATPAQGWPADAPTPRRLCPDQAGAALVALRPMRERRRVASVR